MAKAIVPPMATFCQRGVLATGMAAAMTLGGGEEEWKGEVEWWWRVRLDGLAWESRLGLAEKGGLQRMGETSRKEGWRAKVDARTREVIALMCFFFVVGGVLERGREAGLKCGLEREGKSECEGCWFVGGGRSVSKNEEFC